MVTASAGVCFKPRVGDVVCLSWESSVVKASGLSDVAAQSRTYNV